MCPTGKGFMFIFIGCMLACAPKSYLARIEARHGGPFDPALMAALESEPCGWGSRRLEVLGKRSFMISCLLLCGGRMLVFMIASNCM